MSYGKPPPRPTGSDEEAAWVQWVHDQIATYGKLIDAPGIRFEHTSKGIIPRLSVFGGGGQPGSQAKRFNIKSIQSDYLTCRTWDGTTEGATDVYVAKEQYFRRSLTSAIIDGTTFAFTSYTDNQRTSTAGATSQVEVVRPPYVVYATPTTNYVPVGTIYAVEVGNNTGVTVSDVPVTWIEILPSRVWAKKYA